MHLPEGSLIARSLSARVDDWVVQPVSAFVPAMPRVGIRASTFFVSVPVSGFAISDEIYNLSFPISGTIELILGD